VDGVIDGLIVSRRVSLPATQPRGTSDNVNNKRAVFAEKCGGDFCLRACGMFSCKSQGGAVCC
jgi:hypothetical protein